MFLSQNSFTIESPRPTFEDRANENKVQELQTTNANLSAELQKVKEENKLLITWFTYGGIVAGGGLLLGLILPSLIPSRKKYSRFN